MPYVDLNTIHNPATGTVAPATWGDQTRDNLEFLIDPPVCSISDVAVTVLHNTETDLGATATESFDNDAMHSDVTNRGRITIQTAGRYLLLATMSTDTITGTDGVHIRIGFLKNDTTVYGGIQIKNNSAGTETMRLPAVRALQLAVGDYVEVRCQHTLGGSIQATLEEFTAIFLTR
jgi:hypothetical protein